jgi:hypothetical protein
MNISTVAAIVIALFFLGLSWEILQVLLARVNPSPRKTHIGLAIPSAIAKSRTIPKIIWSYWHESPQPYFVAQCQANWQRFAPDHSIRVLNENSLADWLDPTVITQQFHQLPPFRQADWLRLKLLEQYGGIWIDASSLLSQDLNWVHQLQAEKSSEYVGFYIDRFTTRENEPIIENWFMAAIAKSTFICDLALEFDKAIYMGEENYLKQLESINEFPQIVQGLRRKDQLYLIMHVAAAMVLYKREHPYTLTVLRAEDSALGFHSALKWKKRHLYARMALFPRPNHLPCIFKLRGGDRRIFEKGLSHGWINKKSALAYLMNISQISKE